MFVQPAWVEAYIDAGVSRGTVRHSISSIYMDHDLRLKEFEKLVANRFNVYNSLFLSLPFQQVRRIGVLIPLMADICASGLESGKDPVDILDGFFAQHTDIEAEKDKIDFMFRVIQYVERQVVLFDSVEDASFPDLNQEDDQLSLRETLHLGRRKPEGLGSEESATRDDLADMMSKFSSRIVFTAHPTQFYPPSVLQIIDMLRASIEENDIAGIDQTLRQLGLTSLIADVSPTPIDEARNILHFLRHVYYKSAGDLYSDIKIHAPGGQFDNPDVLKLGFWPGGDRDGNPYVTAKTTETVANELRMALMKCYYGEIKELERKLSFRSVQELVAGVRERLYEAMFDPDCIVRFEELHRPLQEVRAQLLSDYSGLYVENVDAFIDRLRIFRTHFATIDIRQNHAVHLQLVTEILQHAGLIDERLEELSQADLTAALLRTDIDVDEDALSDDLLRDTVRTIATIRAIQERNGEEGCNRYVISHAEDEWSVLFVFALIRWVWKLDDVTVDIIPLFESMAGMSNAPGIVTRLFGEPTYRRHVSSRKNRQTLMLGFSDGTKDGGYFQANWMIQKAKEALTTACRAHDVDAVFFDGRGGPPARGGGKTHRFYASQGSDVANHAIELTIQGQMISSKYGTNAHFRYNCEQLIAAGLHRHLFGADHTIDSAQRALMDELAELSFSCYDALKKHASFIPYLENRSTLPFYTRARIGSRPASRSSDKSLSLDDLRAIPFVGSWSQLKQNVPGYYGIGSAFQKIADSGRLLELKALFREVPFFRTLMLNSMMSLSKCRFELTAYMADDPEFGEFWNLLHDEYERSVRMLLEVSGYDRLMQEEPVALASIQIRENLVIPLLLIQQYALMKIEADDSRRGVYEKMVTRSLYGNINASRNSA